ncbi:MAG: biotin-independent malonate decarboxylase subunit beta, partial [Enterobacteriaceae bacterium]
MENFILQLPAQQPLTQHQMAGVVASGDLEVIYSPAQEGQLTVKVQTSANGQQQVWRNIFTRLSAQMALPAGQLEIHDFAATPGMVKLRLQQCLLPSLDTAPSPHADQQSFIELSARERVKTLLDPGSFRELLGPWEHIASPWLERQGIVVGTDDGMVIGKGSVQGIPTVIAAIEGLFQGGSMGEVSAAKMAAALELAEEDNDNGQRTQVVLLLESGGVRLQEANLGLAGIADIHAAIVSLQRKVPVVAIIAGTVGCFGGMSIAAALCSRVIMTREARLGLNGPQVI